MTQATTYLHVTPTDHTGRHRADDQPPTGRHRTPTLPSRAVPPAPGHPARLGAGRLPHPTGGDPMNSLPNLHPDATGLTLFRVLPDGAGRAYTAVEFERGWAGVERFMRILRAVGYVKPSTSGGDGYGVLDVLNADGDIVQDYAVPHSRAFGYIKRKLKLRVEATR